MHGPETKTARPTHGEALARAGALPVLRRAVFTAAAVLAAFAPSATADDRIATWWQEAAGTAPLLQAPPPPVKPTICMIDTGVTPTPDLDITGRFSEVGGTLDDINAIPGQPGHGTAVAHFAAGKVNGWGGAGAFPHARVASVRVFAQRGGTARWQDYLRALDTCDRVAGPLLKVVVIAIGGPVLEGPTATELENRIDRLRNTNSTNVVVAAGNGGGETDFPGRFSASFTVTAVDPGDALCGFSARGQNIDIAAPGCALDQAGWNGSIFSMNGTSFAAPIVGGAIAAIRAYAPHLSAVQAEQKLLEAATRSRPAGPPVLDAAAALRSIGRGDIVDAYRPHTAPAPVDEDVHETIVINAAMASTPPPSLPAELRAKQPSTRRRQVAKPKLTVKRLARGRALVRTTNRPRGAILDLRAGSERAGRESGRITMAVGKATVLRARFLANEGASAWVRVTIKRN